MVSVRHPHTTKAHHISCLRGSSMRVFIAGVLAGPRRSEAVDGETGATKGRGRPPLGDTVEAMHKDPEKDRVEGVPGLYGSGTPSTPVQAVEGVPGLYERFLTVGVYKGMALR